MKNEPHQIEEGDRAQPPAADKRIEYGPVDYWEQLACFQHEVLQTREPDEVEAAEWAYDVVFWKGGNAVLDSKAAPKAAELLRAVAARWGKTDPERANEADRLARMLLGEEVG